MTLQQAKEQVAQKDGFKDWDDARNINPDFDWTHLDEVAELYCQSQKAKAWEEACDEVKRIYDNSLDFSGEESVEETKKCNPYKP